VMIKPSELTPRFSELLKRIVAAHFDETEMAVVTGDAEVSKTFCALPFDHLVFTGSTAVGRLVAESAARNLTPVTLELGGKSPAIIDPDCDLEVIVPRLAVSKLVNAGQTCIAPDYVLLPEGMEDRLSMRCVARWPNSIRRSPTTRITAASSTSAITIACRG